MILIGLILVTTIFSSCESKRESICNYRVEPTVGEVITYISPIDFVPFIHNTMSKSKVKSKTDVSDSYPKMIFGVISDNTFNFLSSVMNSSIPLRSLISYGKFSLGTSKVQSKIFPSLLLVQEQPYPQRLLCSLSILSETPFCNCWSGNMMFIGSTKSCVTQNPCTVNYGENEDTCNILVDPFRTSCVEYDSEMYQGGSAFSPSTYSLHVPVVDDSLSTLLSYLHEVTLAAPSRGSGSEEQETIPEILVLQRMVRGCISLVRAGLQVVPLLPALAFAGMYIMLNEEDISTSAVTQYLLVSGFGLFLSVLLIAIAVIRTISSAVRANVPFADAILGSAFLQQTTTAAGVFYVASFVTSPSVVVLVASSVSSLWSSGLFGVQWLGKAYFVGSVLLAWSITWYSKMFSAESMSLSVLRLFTKCVGCTLLMRASPNIAVSCILTFAGLNIDSIMHALFIVQMEISVANATPSHLYSDAPLLSNEEYDKQGSIHTQIALEKLRQHMVTNPGVVNKLSDSLEMNQRGYVAVMMDRFISGKYSGIPDPSLRDEASLKKQKWYQHWTLRILTWSSVLMAIASVAFSIWLKHFKNLDSK